MDKQAKMRLKSGDVSLRHSAIDELARTGNEEDFSALRAVADGRRRAWLRWYGFGDQQCAIMAISGIGTENAKRYLRGFFEEEVTRHTSLPWVDEREVPIWEYDMHEFPNARGSLGRRLPYTVTIQSTHWGNKPGGEAVEHYYGHARIEEWSGYKIILRDEEAHGIRDSVLSKISIQ